MSPGNTVIKIKLIKGWYRAYALLLPFLFVLFKEGNMEIEELKQLLYELRMKKFMIQKEKEEGEKKNGKY